VKKIAPKAWFTVHGARWTLEIVPPMNAWLWGRWEGVFVVDYGLGPFFLLTVFQ
jgi:hypothetical protein